MQIDFAIEALSRWIDAVAASIHAGFTKFDKRPVVKLVEGEAGRFLLQSGQAPTTRPADHVQIADGKIDQQGTAILAKVSLNSRIELVLRADRFLFRPLELPIRAGEFLSGVVRSQIDRLTPWPSTDAVFGWSSPQNIGRDRMVVTVAAASRTRITPFVRAIVGNGIHSIAVSTCPPGPNGAPIRVWHEIIKQSVHLGLIRRALIVAIAVVGFTTAVAVSASYVVGRGLEEQQQEFAHRVAAARAAAGAAQSAASSSAAAAQRRLEERKQQVLPTALIMNSLARILPDHTYVTELRIEGEKLRLVGMTQDAPSLVGLLEQSSEFEQATFFAPTTRSTSGPGEIFHIETIVRPSTGKRS